MRSHFDEAEWKEDVHAFAGSCAELGAPVAIETSRSGNGAHAWIFFTERVSARDARRLGTAIISHTCARTRKLKLASYDRLFPHQDTMPKGGFGNLIALPLQRKAREEGFTVFVDSDLRPHPDQWEFLASIQPMSPQDIEPSIARATGGAHPLDVTFIDDEDLATPWKRTSKPPLKMQGAMPKALSVTMATCVSSTSWIQVTRPCFECGTSASAATGRWATRFEQTRVLDRAGVRPRRLLQHF